MDDQVNFGGQDINKIDIKEVSLKRFPLPHECNTIVTKDKQVDERSLDVIKYKYQGGE